MPGLGRILLGAVAFVVAVPTLREPVVSALSPGESVSFTLSEAGRPVVWEPCRSIDVLVNVGSLGEGAFLEVVAALHEVGSLTGLDFRPVASQEAPRYDWALSGPGPVPPVVIGWVDPASTDLLDGSPAATVANPGIVSGRRVLLTGAVALDVNRFSDFSDGEGPGQTRRNLLLHEIGHLLGLDHGPGLMDPVIDASTPSGFTPDEVAALGSSYPSC